MKKLLILPILFILLIVGCMPSLTIKYQNLEPLSTNGKSSTTYERGSKIFNSELDNSIVSVSGSLSDQLIFDISIFIWPCPNNASARPMHHQTEVTLTFSIQTAITRCIVVVPGQFNKSYAKNTRSLSKGSRAPKLTK